MKENEKVKLIKQQMLRNTNKEVTKYGFEITRIHLSKEKIFYDYKIYSKFEILIRCLEKIAVIAPFDAKNFGIADNQIYLVNMDGILVSEYDIKKNCYSGILGIPILKCQTCPTGNLKVDVDYFLKYNSEDSEKTFYRCNHCGELIEENIFKEKLLKEVYI